MRNYVLYSLLKSDKGKVPYQLLELGCYLRDLEESKKIAKSAQTRRVIFGNVGEEKENTYSILRYPDDIEERLRLTTLVRDSCLLNQELRWSHKAYALFSELGGLESGASYISGWFRTLEEYRESGLEGLLIKVIYKGPKISLSGTRPSEYQEDLFGVDR